MSQIPDSPDSAAGAGERLKLAREQAGLSVEKVAKDLYLDTRIIQAIETNHFNELGAPVYAKGYLRKYARLVGLSEEDVLTQYLKSPAATPAPALIPMALGSIPASRQPLPGWVRWLVLVIIVVAGVTTLMNLRSSHSEPDDRSVLLSQPLPAVTSGANESVGESAPVDTDASAPVATDKSVVAGGVTLRFSFSGDSWVEVYDAQNQQVLYEMGAANAVREVTAAPPLRVVLGAASAVRVSANSRNIDIPASAKQADVAKFVVKADGSLE
jgi:cytoskeleton protein RodZ